MAFKILAPLLIICILGQISEEDNIWILNDSNFEQSFIQQKEILVNFHSPWSQSSKSLIPEYSKAASSLLSNDPPIHIAKVDATTNPILAEKYGISEYPTLKYISIVGSIKYTGNLTGDSITAFVLKRSQSQIPKYSNITELQIKLEKTKVAVVLFATIDFPNYFEEASKFFDDVEFIVCDDKTAFSYYGVEEGTIMMIKKYDDKIVRYYETMTLNYLIKWIEENKRPYTWQYCSEASEYIFKKKNPALFFFRYEGEASNYNDFYEKFAKEYRNKLVFTHADLSLPAYKKLSVLLGVPKHAQPTFVIIDHDGEGINKYLFFKSVNEEELNSFIKGWINKEIEPYRKSEPIPEQLHAQGVRIIVSHNFQEIVMDSTKDVLVQFYAPWSAACRNLAKDYEKLADSVKGDNELVIGKIDMYLNDVKGQFIQDFPTIKFYPAKNKKGFVFHDDANYENLLQFISEHSSFKAQNPKIDL